MREVSCVDKVIRQVRLAYDFKLFVGCHVWDVLN